MRVDIIALVKSEIERLYLEDDDIDLSIGAADQFSKEDPLVSCSDIEREHLGNVVLPKIGKMASRDEMVVFIKKLPKWLAGGDYDGVNVMTGVQVSTCLIAKEYIEEVLLPKIEGEHVDTPVRKDPHRADWIKARMISRIFFKSLEIPDGLSFEESLCEANRKLLDVGDTRFGGHRRLC